MFCSKIILMGFCILAQTGPLAILDDIPFILDFAPAHSIHKFSPGGDAEGRGGITTNNIDISPIKDRLQ